MRERLAILKPVRYLTSVIAIEPDWLSAAGVKALLLDIDNTLVSREAQGISEDIRSWVRAMRDAGFGICLVTNNWHREVKDTASDLDLPIIMRAMKPLPFALWGALRLLRVAKGQAVVVGDQAFTDILGARLAGIRSILVLPLTQTDLAHTRLLRKLEPLLIGGLRPEDASVPASREAI